MNYAGVFFKGALVFVSSDFVKVEEHYVNSNAITAELICSVNEAILPTPELVDAIYQNATCKISSPALDPADPNSGFKHDEAIEQNLKQCNNKTLVEGHKKTIVRSNDKNHLAIYGWFQKDGTVIQPYSMVHDRDYSDYSQGVRLVYKWAYKDGKFISASELLNEF